MNVYQLIQALAEHEPDAQVDVITAHDRVYNLKVVHGGDYSVSIVLG